MKNMFYFLVNELGMEYFFDEKNGEIIVKYFIDLFRLTGIFDFLRVIKWDGSIIERMKKVLLNLFRIRK